MTRSDLQKLANEKLSDAQILFSAKSWSNAYYLAGYAVELAIKACIAKSFKADTVPDKDVVVKTYSHEFPKLIGNGGADRRVAETGAGESGFWSRLGRR